MRYDVRCGSDLSSGATLTVRVPEAELDLKALYTIQAEPPDFLLPFRYRHVDGEVELTYLPGGRRKLQYLFGPKGPGAYLALWEGALTPLLECRDWFMEPFSFVLDVQYLYCDKGTGTVSYLYVPTLRPCSNEEELRKMAADLARGNPTTSHALENKALHAIMEDFQPSAFLQMLQEELRQPAPSQRAGEGLPRAEPPPPPQPPTAPPPQSGGGAVAEVRDSPRDPEEIVIDLSGAGSRPKKDKEKKKGLFGPKKESADKKHRQGLFGKKKAPPEIALGAAAQPPERPQVQPSPTVPPQIWADEDEVTQLEEGMGMGARLRLIGDMSLPREIEVTAGEGRSFTVGRFDVSVGMPQSSFEFAPRTKAVSRHHAAIERDGEGYLIIDLSSSAGTFVNGQRLNPNVPCRLERGCRVSFGNAGADYVWEE